MPDAHANFAVSQVATAPSPALSGTTLTVQSGHGTRFPATPFNAPVCPNGALATPLNAEIVRVTGIATDVLTIARAQEGSTARAITVGDQIAAAITAKTLTDLEGAAGRLNVSLGVPARAHRASALTAATGTTAVPLDSVDFDPAGSFAGGVYVTPRAGIYLVMGQVRATSANSPQVFQAIVTGGTGLLGTMVSTRSSTDVASLGVVGLISAAAGASIGLNLSNPGSNAAAVEATGGTYMSVMQVA